MIERHEDTYASYWRVNSGYRLPKRLRTKPVCGKKITQIITDIV